MPRATGIVTRARVLNILSRMMTQNLTKMRQREKTMDEGEDVEAEQEVPRIRIDAATSTTEGAETGVQGDEPIQEHAPVSRRYL